MTTTNHRLYKIWLGQGMLRQEQWLLLLLKEGRGFEDTPQAVERYITGLLVAKRLQQGLRYLVRHLQCTFLRKLHQTVLDNVVDEAINVAVYLLLIMQLLYRLLD